MKNTCPKCDTAYNVSAAVIGRKFTCKSCNTPVVVTEDGLDYQNVPAKAAPAAPEAAFDFDAADEDDRKTAKGGKPPKPTKPPKSRSRDEDEEEPERKPKSKKAKEPEPEDDADDLDAPPARKAKKKTVAAVKSGEPSKLMEYVSFREFITPLVMKLVFWVLVALLVGGGLITALGVAVSFGFQGVLAGAAIVFIVIPVNLVLLRIYAELILLAFNIYHRLGEIKKALEKPPEAAAPAGTVNPAAPAPLAPSVAPPAESAL